MRRAPLLIVVLATTAAALSACGGAQPAATQPPPPGGNAPVASAAVSVGDAGPATTTTQTLAPSAGAAGTKLTPQAGDAGVDPKHKGELGRTVADLQAIVASHRDEARACYDNALPAHPGIEGTIDIRWTIDPTGKVTEADLDTSRSELVEPAVANCLIAIVKGIHFNASPKGFETKAHYPFNFHPRSHHTVSGS